MPGESLEEDALGWNLGRYTLHGEIASGGMATVHIGRMTGTAGFSKMVAIKRLHAQFARDPDFVTMFLEEARLAARVHHPNVVQPLDVIATDGEIFLVMEYIRGESLSKIQRLLRPTGERVPLKIAGAVMVGVLHGLHAAHEAVDERGQALGIVHRDVSPQNILIGTDGVPRVLDFGIAKATDRSYATREGDLKGKLAYMAPEQLTAETPLDRRTDIYAASIVLWELVTGRRLFDSDYSSAILARARSSEVAPPSDYVGDLPPGLDDVLRRGLARRPEQRFATAREMAIQLEICMPLATPSKVGEWVESVAADTIAKRAARITEIEAELATSNPADRARELLVELAASSGGPMQQAKVQRESKTRTWKQKDERTMDRGHTPVSIVSSAIILDDRRALPPSATPSSGSIVTGNEDGPTRPLAVPPPGSVRPPAPLPAPTGAFPMARASSPPQPQPQAQNQMPSRPQPQPQPHAQPMPYAAQVAATVRLPPGALPSPPAVVLHGVAAPPPPATAPLVPPQAQAFALPEIAPPVPFEIPRGGGTVNVRPGVSTKPKRSSLLPTLIVLVLAIGAFFFALPTLVKRAYVNEAAKHGIALEVDDVDVAPHRVRLFGCRLRLPDAPGIYVRAAELDFPSRANEPPHLVAHDLDITIDGTYPQIRDAANRWLAAHPLKELSHGKDALQSIEVTKAHVVWGRVLGDNSKIDVDEIHGTIERTAEHALGEDMRLVAGRIELGTPAGSMGPWHGTFLKSPAVVNVDVALAPPGAEPAALTFVDQDNGGLVLDVKIPRSTPDRLGIPKSLLGLAIDESIQLEGAVHVTKPQPTHLTADGWLAVYGVKMAGATIALDVHAAARLDGDPSGSIDVQNGLVTIGNLKGRVYGKGLFVRDGFRVEAPWKTAPRTCEKVTTAADAATANLAQLAWDPGSFASLDKAVGTAPANASQTQLVGTFVVDSRDLAQTRFTGAPTNKCAKLFP